MIDEKVIIAGKTYRLGVGGLHSEDNSGCFQSDDNHKLIFCDVASFYPSLILNERFKPEHLTDKFFDVYRDIKDRRIEAKNSGDKVTDITLKITINSCFGLSNFQYYWLYDPKMFFSITLSGQLLLLDLIEKLELNNIEVISANTDSVFCMLSNNQEDKYFEVCQEWQNRNNLQLDFERPIKYVRRDVNSYMIIYKDKPVKMKGIFVDGLLENTKAKKRVFITSFNAPIIALSLQSYFKDDIKPETTIKQETDIHNFLFSQRIGSQFKLVAQRIERGKLKEVECQKTNRWVVSKKGYRLLKKHRFDGSDSALMRGCNVKIANDINDVDLKEVDKQYYIDETWKIINEVEATKKVQMGLFG